MAGFSTIFSIGGDDTGGRGAAGAAACGAAALAAVPLASTAFVTAVLATEWAGFAPGADFASDTALAPDAGLPSDNVFEVTIDLGCVTFFACGTAGAADCVFEGAVLVGGAPALLLAGLPFAGRLFVALPMADEDGADEDGAMLRARVAEALAEEAPSFEDRASAGCIFVVWVLEV